MARQLRIEYEGAFYHITARGNERKKIFFANPDYEKFREYLRNAQEKYGYLLHSYILMTNHYHLLIETPNANMNKIMHYLNGSYTNYINRRRRRSGHLFQGRYKAILIDKDSYLLELSRYIHLNPVRAKIVQKPEDYPESSYQYFIRRSKEDLVCADLILKMVSPNSDARKKYRAFVEKAIGENQEDPLKNIFAGAILGSKIFAKEALDRLKDGVIQKKEISHRKELDSAYTAELIIEAIAGYFKVGYEDILKNKGDYRKIAIFFLKNKTSLTNRQIGMLFGGLTYSAVAKVHERFSKKIDESESLNKTVYRISKNMSYVKG
jgi:REP element-mobilizing transposase RayT